MTYKEYKQFWEQLDYLDNDVDRIDFLLYLKNKNHPFNLESQPEAILQRFYRVDYSKDSNVDELTIAQTMVDLFGKLILCRESTYCVKKPITIIDEIEDPYNDYGDYKLNYRIYNIHKALIDLGVKKAE
jgi:hypothetical protein